MKEEGKERERERKNGTQIGTSGSQLVAKMELNEPNSFGRERKPLGACNVVQFFSPHSL